MSNVSKILSSSGTLLPVRVESEGAPAASLSDLEESA